MKTPAKCTASTPFPCGREKASLNASLVCASSVGNGERRLYSVKVGFSPHSVRWAVFNAAICTRSTCVHGVVHRIAQVSTPCGNGRRRNFHNNKVCSLSRKRGAQFHVPNRATRACGAASESWYRTTLRRRTSVPVARKGRVRRASYLRSQHTSPFKLPCSIPGTPLAHVPPGVKCHGGGRHGEVAKRWRHEGEVYARQPR